MKDTINTYFAVLLITIAGAGAAQLIIHIAYADASKYMYVSPSTAALEKSILNQP